MTRSPRDVARPGNPQPRRWLAVDLRPYRHHVGAFVIGERVTVRGRWTPFVLARVRRQRAADGGTEF